MKTQKIRTLSIIVLIVLSNSVIFAQDYEKVDSIVRTYPKKFSNPNDLASIINRDFILQEEKARAIFTWIAYNIEYDVQKLTSRPPLNDYLKLTDEEKAEREKILRRGIATNTLIDGKGVCLEYSILFRDLCRLVSLECVEIDGAAKNGILNFDSIPNQINHVWNAVKIDNNWKLIDVTWAAGRVDLNNSVFIQEFNDFFFFTPPEIFAKSHFPIEKKWLMTKMTKEKFDKMPIYFHSYFEKNIRIQKPRNGKISAGWKKRLKFVINDCTNEEYYLKFENEEIKRTPKIKLADNKCILEIDYKYSNDTYLTLYIGEQRLARYLVTR
jgi:transglutaminase/protease-like cytokinesis protein 3